MQGRDNGAWRAPPAFFAWSEIHLGMSAC